MLYARGLRVNLRVVSLGVLGLRLVGACFSCCCCVLLESMFGG